MVSRSGTLTYQIGNELAQRGFGNSTIVGIGGDPVPGSSFIDVLELFEADPETELIVMAGEIGGDAEERRADFIAEHVSKPVVAYIAGFTAPPGKTMGHAGRDRVRQRGTAQAKAEALEAKGVRVGRTPTEVAEIAMAMLAMTARLISTASLSLARAKRRETDQFTSAPRGVISAIEPLRPAQLTGVAGGTHGRAWRGTTALLAEIRAPGWALHDATRRPRRAGGNRVAGSISDYKECGR